MSSPRIDLLFSSSKFVANGEYGITQYPAVSVVHESFRSGRTLGSSETVDSVIQRPSSASFARALSHWFRRFAASNDTPSEAGPH